MKIYAIGDLHLSGLKPKPMDIFGENWKDHDKVIETKWKETVAGDDIVLIPGDISWANELDEVMPNLEWIDSLPGKKVIIRGNHDYWWKSISQVRKILPKSIHALQNDSIMFDDVAITGTRLWDDPEISFYDEIDWKPREELGLLPKRYDPDEDEKIFDRELGRLNLALESVPGSAKVIIVMLHYPPTDFRFSHTRTTETLLKFGADICVYGHLHTLKKKKTPKFPVKKWGMEFYLVSSDFLDFQPVLIYDPENYKKDANFFNKV